MRKYLVTLFILAIAFSYSYAQKQTIFKVDVKKSNIVWAGRKVGGDHEGTIKFKSGELIFNGKYLVGGSFVVDMNSIQNTDLKDKAQNQKLVNQLKSDDFFGVEKFPEAKLEILNADRKLNQDYFVTANLTIKGKTNKIKFPAVIQLMEDDKAYTRITLSFDRTKFDIKWGSSLAGKIGDIVVYDDVDLIIELFTDKK